MAASLREEVAAHGAREFGGASSSDDEAPCGLPAPRASTGAGRRRALAVGAAALLGCALLAAGPGRRWLRAPVGRSAAAEAGGALALAEEVAPEAEGACAAMGKSCLSSRCCATPGFQCFRKNSGWAACRRSCVAGRDPTDPDDSPWDCKELGARAPGEPPAPDFSLKPAAWVAERCSGAGQDCSSSQCCKDAGAQCYVKTRGWSACKAECTPGPDPTDADNHPWECGLKGMRTPGPPSKSLGKAQGWVAEQCSAVGEQCLHTKCCKEPGQQCFKKHDTWAMCMEECTPGPFLTDKDPGMWNCTPLGGRTPGIPKIAPHLAIAPWVKTKCAKVGTNCESSMCCADDAHQCYQKAPGWATCMQSCTPGPLPGDKAGGDWSCKKLGPRTPRPWGTPSLYCFSVVMLSTYEAGIMRQALRNGGLGIFRCEAYDVFSQDGETVLGDGPLGEVRTHHFIPAAVTRSVDGTAGNAALFEHVWDAVKWVGAYKLTDWTVKCDPDAVPIPDRLRGHLQPHTGATTYIVNCNKQGMATGPMMFGSVEAISRQALDRYFLDHSACLGQEMYAFGEDRWLGGCLNKLGVMGSSDFGMVGDNVCTGANCADGKAAYHPFKNEAAWLGCWNTAMR